MATKVYLSRSNASDMTFASNVRDRLKHAGFEVLEFQGGKWTTADNRYMLSAEHLIIIPPTKRKADEPYEINLGRGQFEQVVFWEQQKGYQSILTVESTIGLNDLDLRGIDSMYQGEDNYVDEWGYVFMETDNGHSDGIIQQYRISDLLPIVENCRPKSTHPDLDKDMKEINDRWKHQSYGTTVDPAWYSAEQARQYKTVVGGATGAASNRSTVIINDGAQAPFTIERMNLLLGHKVVPILAASLFI